MTGPGRAPRCADAARAHGDPRAGTAAPVTRWFLVEQPGPWGPDALTSSRLDRAVADDVARRAEEAGARVLLVRRHGRPGHATQGRRHWALVDSRPGSEAVRWGRFSDDEELLEVPLDGPVVPRAHAGPGDAGRPVFLVCAHGRHDTCCAVRGREVAAVLDELAPGRVWECSHVGGCRFAANVVVLPQGLYYGGVTPASAPSLAAATEDGHVVPGLLRGRSSQPGEVQAAEHHARAWLGTTGTTRTGGPTAMAAFRHRASHGSADGAVAVELEQVGSARTLLVTVRRVASGPPRLLTCAATAPAAPPRWELVDVRERGPVG